MQYRKFRNALSAVVVAGAGLAFVASASAATSESGVWKRHEAKFTYQGFTSKYTCDGLESKVRQILLALGARKSDLKVVATGCPYGPHQPSDFAWVSVDMHSLVASAPADAAPVSARWAPVQLAPRRPYFMGEGECELVEQLEKVISSSFATRDLEYRAGCTPHSVSLGDYRVSGQVLLPQ